MVGYTNGGSGVRYSCARGVADYAEPVCQSLSGQRLDEFIGSQVLAALQPAILELHLAAAADLRQERQRLHQHWQQQLERARTRSGTFSLFGRPTTKKPIWPRGHSVST